MCIGNDEANPLCDECFAKLKYMKKGEEFEPCSFVVAAKLRGSWVSVPSRNFHHAIPLFKSFGSILVANALAT